MQLANSVPVLRLNESLLSIQPVELIYPIFSNVPITTGDGTVQPRRFRYATVLGSCGGVFGDASVHRSVLSGAGVDDAEKFGCRSVSYLRPVKTPIRRNGGGLFFKFFVGEVAAAFQWADSQVFA